LTCQQLNFFPSIPYHHYKSPPLEEQWGRVNDKLEDSHEWGDRLRKGQTGLEEELYRHKTLKKNESKEKDHNIAHIGSAFLLRLCFPIAVGDW